MFGIDTQWEPSDSFWRTEMALTFDRLAPAAWSLGTRTLAMSSSPAIKVTCLGEPMRFPGRVPVVTRAVSQARNVDFPIPARPPRRLTTPRGMVSSQAHSRRSGLTVSSGCTRRLRLFVATLITPSKLEVISPRRDGRWGADQLVMKVVTKPLVVTSVQGNT